jgi:50S ribosomal protein L16 3-hydroxylase
MSGDLRLNLNVDSFLAQHWQQKPLLIPCGVPDFTPPCSADELAGLALELEVESRIIAGTDSDWSLQHGPFTDQDFQRDVPWTLLVQAVDHLLPEVAELRKLFDFIPQWRMDDVMVSYASTGGSVGPHFDYYDVFLLQGEGERLWRLGQHCDGSSPLLDNDELRILKDFEIKEEHLLRSGDILYVPPGVAHWGIAQGDCTTFSIGFRAPRLNGMVSRWVDNIIGRVDPDRFYQDAGQTSSKLAGEIRSSDIERAKQQLQRALQEHEGDQWFGELVTEPRYETAQDDVHLAETSALLSLSVKRIELSPAAKVAWQKSEAGITVFANGDSMKTIAAALQPLTALCGGMALQSSTLSRALDDASINALLQWLLHCDCLDIE